MNIGVDLGQPVCSGMPNTVGDRYISSKARLFRASPCSALSHTRRPLSTRIVFKYSLFWSLRGRPQAAPVRFDKGCLETQCLGRE